MPFIGQCIILGNVNDYSFANENGRTLTVNALNAFPVLAAGLTNVLMTVFFLLSFASVIVAGVLMTLSGAAGTYARGKKLLIKVAIAMALLGVITAVLRSINPNFFVNESDPIASVQENDHMNLRS